MYWVLSRGICSIKSAGGSMVALQHLESEFERLYLSKKTSKKFCVSFLKSAAFHDVVKIKSKSDFTSPRC